MAKPPREASRGNASAPTAGVNLRDPSLPVMQSIAIRNPGGISDPSTALGHHVYRDSSASAIDASATPDIGRLGPRSAGS